ncbi:OmpA family protein [Hymenobacter sp. BT175]|uniref:OmpA family protein n=1 Tax=Hymenobacter translucens TaxID=2886507 RepID=UPI001D0F3B31|nr:OmpA family protein [Hymenobacter translucens]MCC2547213.1 OmpA family protein [Hymenobacter translucens]
MKTAFILAGALALLPLASQAQFGYLTSAVERAAERAASRKIEDAVERKLTEKTEAYYNSLITDGRFVSYRMQFEPGTATLLPDAQPVISSLVKVMKDRPGMKLTIEVHSLLEGDAVANLALSKRRAEVIRAAFVQAGIPIQRLKANGMGEKVPLSTDTADGLDALNQRVEFVKGES